MIQKYNIRRRTKKEVKKERLVSARESAKVQADVIGYKYPIAWTTEEALKYQNCLVGLSGTKLILVSRIHSVADATSTRLEVAYSQQDTVKYICPFPRCTFVAKICFRKRGSETFFCQPT